MDFFKALQAKALLGVERTDHESWLRHVYRFYSRTFSTPLHLVPELPLEDVVLAYYEEAFENMSEEEREDFLERLTETDEERRQRLADEKKVESADDEFYQSLNAEVKAGMPKPKGEAEPPKKTGGLILDQPPKAPPPDLPEISMDFGDGNLFDGLLDQDPLAPPPRKKP